MNDQSPTPETGSSSQAQGATGPHATIDIEKLAEKVYQLMCADARLTQARGQTRRSKERNHAQ